MRWPWQRRRYRAPKRLCPWCPIETERAVQRVLRNPAVSESELFTYPPRLLTGAELDEYRKKIAAGIREVASEFPPPCVECPVMQPKDWGG